MNEEGESEPLETDHAILAKNPYDPPSAPGLPEIIDYDENMVELKWEMPIRDGGAPITGENGIIDEVYPLSGGGAPNTLRCTTKNNNNNARWSVDLETPKAQI